MFCSFSASRARGRGRGGRSAQGPTDLMTGRMCPAAFATVARTAGARELEELQGWRNGSVAGHMRTVRVGYFGRSLSLVLPAAMRSEDQDWRRPDLVAESVGYRLQAPRLTELCACAPAHGLCVAAPSESKTSGFHVEPDVAEQNAARDWARLPDQLASKFSALPTTRTTNSKPPSSSNTGAARAFTSGIGSLSARPIPRSRVSASSFMKRVFSRARSETVDAIRRSSSSMSRSVEVRGM